MNYLPYPLSYLTEVFLEAWGYDRGFFSIQSKQVRFLFLWSETAILVGTVL